MLTSDEKMSDPLNNSDSKVEAFSDIISSDSLPPQAVTSTNGTKGSQVV